MAQQCNLSARRAVIGACMAATIGLAGSAAAQWNGGDWRRGSSHHRDVSATLILNGERICIDGHSVVAGIAEALRCKGYRVSVHDGCITVHYRGRSPSITLVGCDYGLQVSRSRGCLVVRPYLIDRHDHRRGGYDRDWRRDRNDHHSRNRRPTYRRWGSCSTSGISIRFGGGW